MAVWSQWWPSTHYHNSTLIVDGESVNILVFVRPDSEQSCLLGMNAIPSWGLPFPLGDYRLA